MLHEIRVITKGGWAGHVQLVYRTEAGEPDGVTTYDGEVARIIQEVAACAERQAAERIDKALREIKPQDADPVKTLRKVLL